MIKSRNTNWKRKMNLEDEDEVSNTSLPFIINSGNEPQSSCGIRVVENNIFFYGEIDDQSCLELNRILMEVDFKLQNLKTSIGVGYEPIIHLHINTIGGEVYAALSSVDTIRNLKSSVYTYADGLVASAGTLISTIGTKRFCGEHSYMLIHQLSSGLYGNFAELQAGMDTTASLMKFLKEFYKKNTKIPMKKMNELMSKDIYLTSNECLVYGIVDEIR